MAAVERRYREEVDDTEVEAQERREVQQRHEAHLGDLPRHLRDADGPCELRARQLEDDLVECVDHHVEDGPRLLHGKLCRLDEARVARVDRTHDADHRALRARVIRRRDRRRECLAAALDRQIDGLTRAVLDAAHKVGPRRNRRAVDGQHAVAVPEARLCRRLAREHRAEDRLGTRRADAGEEEDAEEQEQRQDEIHDGAREDHDHARTHGFLAVAAAARVVLLGVHAGDVVEAAERDRADGVHRLAALEAHELRAKADGKLVDAHARHLRRGKVTELMDEDEQAEDEYGGCYCQYHCFTIL